MDNFLKVQEIVDKLLKLGFDDQFKATYTLLSDHEIQIDINGENVSYLIGQHGSTLFALQNIIRQIYIQESQDFEERVKIILDIDGYKQKRVDKIKDMAFSTAQKVLKFNKEFALPVMSAYERHIVHDFIQENHPEIKTSSQGEEPNRRVVLHPISE